MEENRLAIVLLNWNGKHLLSQFLPKTIEHSGNADIYVIDNNSEDGSVDYLKKIFPGVKRIVLNKNKGFARGYNEGLKQIDSDLFCLLNTDVAVTPGWLLPILKHFKENSETAIAQPQILDFNRPEYFEYAGAAGGFIDRLGYPFCRGRIFGSIEKNTGQFCETKPVFWASGACFFIRKEVFMQLGGFDSDFFAHQEEIDLCWRAKNNGFKTACIGASKVFHIGSATLPVSFTKVFLNHRNSLFMLLKNLPGGKLWSVLLERLLWDSVAAIRYLIIFKPVFFWAILKAHCSFYKKLRKYRQKRTNQLFSENYYFVNNILVQYYLCSVKKFSHLNNIKSKFS